MKRAFTFIGILVIVLTACEDLYNPRIEMPERVLVVDARIVHGMDDNFVKLNLSKGFDEIGVNYPEVVGASVLLTDDENTEYKLPEISNGIFHVDRNLDTKRSYRININYEGEIYESEYESIPELPKMDSVYGFPEDRIIVFGGADDVDDFLRKPGLMLYTDITTNKNVNYYRFSARKTYQYVYHQGDQTVFAWKSFNPFEEAINIAAPAEYSASKNIKKHSLFFMEKKLSLGRDKYFQGWILFLHQYAISQDAYNFYKDVNSVLKADGRMFDPMYIQARNNLKCVSSPGKSVLGSFEIASHKEYRFFIWFLSDQQGYLVKPIPYFYDIPPEGKSVDRYPEFWEFPGKRNYP